jgi:hypothetical protein
MSQLEKEKKQLRGREDYIRRREEANQKLASDITETEEMLAQRRKAIETDFENLTALDRQMKEEARRLQFEKQAFESHKADQARQLRADIQALESQKRDLQQSSKQDRESSLQRHKIAYEVSLYGDF